MSRFALLPLAVLLIAGLAACDFGPPKDTMNYPDYRSESFNVYARYCSQCHAPPLPSAHPASEWPGVIARMQQHLLQRSMAPIPVGDMTVLRDYLLAHAAGEKA